ncbi:dipeptide epimerase [Vampirovibrio sp.]|uniref:dipeptide epimerase n=1 Tax=Vampirovibrio sp. TaxID=2717857 RepID=UPI0035948834
MKLQYETLDIPYEFTFTISRHSHSHATTVIATLSWERNGQTYQGQGEAVPSQFYGEDAQSVCRFYQQLTESGLLSDLTPFDLQKLHTRFAALEGNMAAKSGIDQAFYDLQGKYLNMPVWQLWGLDPAQAPKSSYTIGIADLDTVKRKTEVALSRGYDVLKVKLGSPNDVEIFEAIRALAPHPQITMRVDANAGWEVSDFLEIAQLLRENHVEFVEEPLKLSCTDEDYARLKAESPLPLMADESCHVLGDIPRCAQYFHAINLKHTKTGGLTEALRMIHAARAHGLGIMLGGFGESSLSVTAFAQLSPLVDYCDLDGALLMAEDAYEGIRFEGSRFYLPHRPGLGVIPRQGHP